MATTSPRTRPRSLTCLEPEIKENFLASPASQNFSRERLRWRRPSDAQADVREGVTTGNALSPGAVFRRLAFSGNPALAAILRRCHRTQICIVRARSFFGPLAAWAELHVSTPSIEERSGHATQAVVPRASSPAIEAATRAGFEWRVRRGAWRDNVVKPRIDAAVPSAIPCSDGSALSIGYCARARLCMLPCLARL
jgi:hypothetical protein